MQRKRLESYRGKNMTREEQIREIDEAIFAGQRAYQAICEAESHLSSARGFGIWDMLGGGFVSG